MEDASITGRGMTICQACGHGSELHSGQGDDERAAGWCVACEDRWATGEPNRIRCARLVPV